MAVKKTKSQSKNVESPKVKVAAKKSIKTKPVAPAVKPKVRVSRVSVGLGLKRPSGEGVVDLKSLSGAKKPSNFKSKIADKGGKIYGSDAYDEDLEKGESDLEDDLFNEPVESLGELLNEEERLSYEDEAAAKTVGRHQPAAKATRARTADNSGGKIYKKLALGFVILALVVAAAVAYFVLVKVKISVSLKNEALSGETHFNIYYTSSSSTLPEHALKGLVKKIEIEQTKAFQVAGSEVIGEEVSGTMIIYNKYIKNQPLVATTRLLGADGKLFRLKNSVNVPAGGQLEAEVYADQPKADMTVGDERFTIPGLWEGLQDKVYAESKAGDIAYKKKTKGIVSQEDIDKAMKEMKDGLLAQAKTEIENTYGDFKKQLYQIDETSLVSEVDSKVGQEKEQIVIKLKGSVLAVAFNGDESLALVKTKALSLLTSNKQLADLKDEAITYQLLKVDADNKIAEVNAAFVSQVNLTSLDNLIDKSKLTNLSADQLTAYLKGIPELASYKINFYPPFIQKTPALVDRIEIVLEK